MLHRLLISIRAGPKLSLGLVLRGPHAVVEVRGELQVALEVLVAVRDEGAVVHVATAAPERLPGGQCSNH
eukprot:8373228-Pyramimonas_sp.AAC.1